MQVREVMTNNPACCTPDASLQEVARMMVENDCGCIPVVDSQSGMKPVGTITDRDITIRTVAAGQNPLEMKASDVMSIDLATIKPDSSLEECFKSMEEKNIRRILVVDEKGRCCGIVAQADVVQQNTSPGRAHEFLRDISASSPSHNLTMSRDYESNRSYFNSSSVVPILLGIGSVAALMYFLGQRKSSSREYFNLKTDAPESDFLNATNQENFGKYADAEEEIEKRQHYIENRVQALRTDIQSLTESETGSATPGRFELKQSGAAGQYHFNLRAGNGQIILTSEMYNSRSAAEKGIESVKKYALDEKRYERKVGLNNQPYFVLKAGNGEEIGKSETYSSEPAMEKGIASVMKNAPGAQISETAG